MPRGGALPLSQCRAPRFHQRVKAFRRVGGGGGGQADCLPSRDGQLVLPVILFRRFAVDEDGPDGGCLQYDGKVGGHGGPDGAVRAALDLTGGKHVPQGDPVFEQKRDLFLRRHGQVPAVNGGQHPPEPVLRVAVKEARLPRFHGRKAAEDQNFTVPVVHRRDWVGDVSYVFHGLSKKQKYIET